MTIWPELTTIRMPIRQMAMGGIDMLVEAIRGRKKTPKITHKLFDHRFIRRQSDAPPPTFRAHSI